MINWLTRKNRLDLLEKKLRQAAKLARPLSQTRKSTLRKRVMNQINEAMAREEIGFEQIAEQLEKLTLTVAPSKRFRLHARQSLLDTLTLREQRLWMGDLFREVLQRRRVWATVMACLLLVTVTFGYVIQTPQVSAAKASMVDSIRGTATASRNGEIIPLEVGYLVQEGDVIHTEGDGWVDVIFVDDSLVTMGPETTATVSRLWVDPQNEANTSIVMEVETGRAWADVVNLSPGNSVFTMAAGDSTFSSDRKATFDVRVLDDDVRLRVFSRLVDFNVFADETVRRGTLGVNLEMHVTDDDLTILKLEDREALLADDVWVQTNLDTNAKYQERLQAFYAERAAQQAGFVPGDSFYFLERSIEHAQLLFAFDDEARSQLTRNLAEQRLSEASFLINQGNVDAAAQALEAYQSTVVDLAGQGSVSEKDVQAVLDESKKMMDGSGTSETLHEVRNTVEATSLLVAADDAERSVMNLETAADRLGLAYELIQIGAYDLARQSLEDYQSGLNGVIEGLPNLEMEDRQVVVLGILDQKLRDLQMLKLIAGELEALVNGEREASAGVQAQVEAVYTDTLLQLNTLVLSLKERAVMQLSVFLEDVKGDEDIQLEVLNRLKKSVDLEFEFMQIINDLEEFYEDDSLDVVILDDGFAAVAIEEGAPLQNYLEGRVENTAAPQDLEVREI